MGPIAEQVALAAFQVDGEESSAHHALGCTHLFARRLDDSLAELDAALRELEGFRRAGLD